MTTIRLVNAARRATISKLFAALLVVLAVLPFTAPFASFSPSEFAGEAADSGGSPLAKSQTATISWDVNPVVASTRSSEGTHTDLCTPLDDPGQIRPAVLRL